MTTRSARRRLGVVATDGANQVVRRYASGLARDNVETEVVVRQSAMKGNLEDVASDFDALVIVGDSRRAPRTSVKGLVVESRDGRVVPVGWLPYTRATEVRRFIGATTAVASRTPSLPTVAVLAQRSKRYRHLAGRIVARLAEAADGPAVVSMTADEVTREELVQGLGLGLGAAIYLGHGRPVGWVGYRGVRRHHTAELEKPIGVVFSLTCLTASRRRVGVSFAETLPLDGACAAVLASVVPTNHVENARWALRIARSWTRAESPELGEIVASAYDGSRLMSSYRIIGDPLTRIADAVGLADRLAHFSELTAPPAVGASR